VLWTAVAATKRAHPNCISLVYTGDTDATKEQIIAQVKARFAISLDPRSLHFVFLKKRHLVEDATWPRFTLLGQSLGSMILAWEALSQVIPDLYIGVPTSFDCCRMADTHAAQTAWATLSHSMSLLGSRRAPLKLVHTCITQQ